jgi:outer membrane protein
MMKTLKTLLLATVLMVCANAAKAQLKIAYIYADSLVIMMPEAKKADSAVQSESAKWEKVLSKTEESAKASYDTLMSMTERKVPTSDPFYQMELSNYELQSKKLNDLQQNAQNNIALKRQQVYEPIINKIKQTIADVAKEKGYTYVFDASSGGLLYSPPSDNLMNDVKKKLGLK